MGDVTRLDRDGQGGTLHEEFLAWAQRTGLQDAPRIWHLFVLIERWLARNRLPLIAADRSDIDAWADSRDGQALGGRDGEGIAAIRVVIGFLDDMGHRRASSTAPPCSSVDQDIAPVVGIGAHLEAGR